MYTICLNHIHPSLLPPTPSGTLSLQLHVLPMYIRICMYLCKCACIFNSSPVRAAHRCLERVIHWGVGNLPVITTSEKTALPPPQQPQMDTLDFLYKVPVSLVAIEIQRLGSHHTASSTQIFPFTGTPLEGA